LLHEWLALHELGDLLVEVHIAFLLRNRTTMKPIHTFSGETHRNPFVQILVFHREKEEKRKRDLCRYWCFREKRKGRGREKEERWGRKWVGHDSGVCKMKKIKNKNK
jgi:hypothetical protein